MFDWNDPMSLLISGLMIFLVLFLGIFFADVFTQELSEPITGEVIYLDFSPSKNSVGVAPIIGSNSSSGVAVVNSYTPEKFTVFIQLNDGTKERFTMDQDDFLSIKIGDKVTFRENIGGVLGIRYGIELEN